MELETKNRANTAKTTKELSKEAISLALSGEWEKAAVLNRVILDVCPKDVEAMNRLGKALMESGQYGEAKTVLVKVVEASPYNNIAKKNLVRLEQLEGAPAPARQGRKLSGTPSCSSRKAASRARPSCKSRAPVRWWPALPPATRSLAVENNGLCVYARDDEYLGRVEPKLGRRVMRLLEAGNRYEAAVIGVKEQGTSIIMRETYRHPSLNNVCSFPAKSKEDHRRRLGENNIRYLEDSDLDDPEDDGLIDGEPGDDPDDDLEWEE